MTDQPNHVRTEATEQPSIPNTERTNEAVSRPGRKLFGTGRLLAVALLASIVNYLWLGGSPVLVLVAIPAVLLARSVFLRPRLSLLLALALGRLTWVAAVWLVVGFVIYVLAQSPDFTITHGLVLGVLAGLALPSFRR